MKNKKGQILLEFIFSMMVIFFMIYSTVHIFRWTGLDLAERRKAHDSKLIEGINENAMDGPLKQLETVFYTPIGLKATAPVKAP